MIIVHHLNQSRAHRILWLLEELGVPYEVKYYQRDPQTMLAPPSLKQIHPLGKSPVITDNGRVYAESGAIIEYLLETYGNGRFQPVKGTQEYTDYRFFLHYAEGSVMAPLLIALIMWKITQPPVPFFIRPIAKAISGQVNKTFTNPNIKTHFDFIESTLSKHEWLAGSEFTAADIQMSYPVEAGAERVGYENRPHIRKFIERMRARPAYQRALAREVPT